MLELDVCQRPPSPRQDPPLGEDRAPSSRTVGLRFPADQTQVPGELLAEDPPTQASGQKAVPQKHPPAYPAGIWCFIVRLFAWFSSAADLLEEVSS